MAQNIAPTLSDEQQTDLVQKLLHWVDRDLESRAEWESRQDEAYKLWALDPPARKLPWQDASNICVPMIASAVNNWAGLTASAMFEGPDRVEAIPTEANDVRRSERVKGIMDWQILYEMEGEYEGEYDKLLPHLAITGTAFKKAWYDQDEDRIHSVFISALDVIVPDDTRSLKDARRITHRFEQHLDEIERLEDAGMYVNADKVSAAIDGEESQPNPSKKSEDDRQGHHPSEDEQVPNTVYEMHFWASRDMIPGHESWEKWIATFTHEGTLLRLVKHPKKIGSFFVDYHFIPGEKFYSYGFGHFLKPINLAYNAVMNQYIDAGRIANNPFVFHGKGSGLRGRKIKVEPGSSVEIDDVTQVLLTKFPGLDQNLPQMMMFLKEFGQDISANNDSIQGRVQRGVREPTVRGESQRSSRSFSRLKVYSNRVFRAQDRELRLFFELNSIHLPEKKQYKVLGSTENAPFREAFRKDFDKNFHLKITSNPDFSSTEQRRDEALQLMQLAMQHPLIGLPNPQTGAPADPPLLMKFTQDFMTSMGKKDLHRFLPPLPDPPIPPHEENQAMIDGEEISPKTGEDHAQHLTEHASLLGTEDEAVVARIERHMTRHRQQALSEQQLAEQQELLAQSAQGGGNGAGNGQVPSPPPAPDVGGRLV